MSECHCGESRRLKIQCEELRTRVAYLEAFIPSAAQFDEIEKERDELQNSLSTLLKASEGMEKALEYIGKQDESGYTVHEAQYISDCAKQALADFRAVKEEMK